MSSQTRHPALEHLGALAGEWETEATHPYIPDTLIRGRATFELLAGGHFLIWRVSYDHPDIPDSIAILGCGDMGASGASGDSDSECSMHYFDARGVSRLYQMSAHANIWRFWRDTPDFSQRYTCTISPDGNTMEGIGELSREGSTWEPDLHVTYLRLNR